MKISKKFRYGLRAMAELASYYKQGSQPAKMVSKRQGIPLQYLEQIFNKLKKKGLIKAERGPKGGYLLSRSPSKIKVNHIIEALEGGYSLTDCIGTKGKQACSRVDFCSTKKFWVKLNKSVRVILESTTLQDLSIKPKTTKDSKISHNYLFQI